MHRTLGLGLVALLATAGCGGSSGTYTATTVPVKGKVTYNGQPVTQGTVVFEPEGAGREAHGEVQSDGTFVLSTYKDGDGAVAGAHRVAVTGMPRAGKSVVPAKFRNVSSSRIQLDVTPDKSEYNIELK